MTDPVVREALSLTYGVAFALLTMRAVIQWRRRHDAAARWFAVAFGALALVVFLGAVVEAAWGRGDGPLALRLLSIALLAAHPPALLQFSAAFGGVTRAERVVTAAGFAALVLAVPFVDPPAAGEPRGAAATAWTAALIVGWTLVAARVTGTLWFRSVGRPGIVRGRMRLLAVGVALLNVALVIETTHPGRDVVVGILATLSALVALAGFAPPAALRTILRQRDQPRLRAAIRGIVAARSDLEVRDTLLPTAREMLGVRAVALLHGDDLAGFVSGYEDVEVEQIRARVRRLSLAPGSSVLHEGHLIGRYEDTWTVVDMPDGGAIFGADELEVLASVNAVAIVALARLRDSQRVVEHEQQLKAAIELAGLGEWEWRIGDDVVEWSPRMYEIFGIREDGPMTYERYRSLLPPEDLARISGRIGRALAGDESYDIDHAIARTDGTQVFVHSRARVVRADDGTPLALRGVTMDITARKQSERQLEAAVQHEREVVDRLRAIDELKTGILSAVSHELRTPLTAVHGLSILLQDRVEELDPAKRREIIDHLVHESERLAGLFADLLDIDRLRRGLVAADLEPTDVAQLVRGVVMRRQSTRVTLDLDDVTCLLDAPKAERVVENLIENAEKHAGFDASVWVRVVPDGDGVCVRVEDDGPGVPEHLRDEVFEPFNRGEEQLGHAPGTGIGLALVAQFARLHGGCAWTEERDGGGAAFVVTFPGVPVGAARRTPA